MANRTESAMAHAWGRNSRGILETSKSLRDGSLEARDVDEYESASYAVDARARTAARQMVDRFQRRFGPWATDAVNAIYDDSSKPEDRQEKFNEIYDALYNPQDPRNAAALMEERIIPYSYGILQSDSSFPDGE